MKCTTERTRPSCEEWISLLLYPSLLLVANISNPSNALISANFFTALRQSRKEWLSLLLHPSLLLLLQHLQPSHYSHLLQLFHCSFSWQTLNPRLPPAIRLALVNWICGFSLKWSEIREVNDPFLTIYFFGRISETSPEVSDSHKDLPWRFENPLYLPCQIVGSQNDLNNVE